jgi:hypothetical protein
VDGKEESIVLFFYFLDRRSLAWWHMTVIPALGRLRQDDHEVKDSLVYIVRPCLKKKKDNSFQIQKRDTFPDLSHF